jgi:hypothetical protein
MNHLESISLDELMKVAALQTRVDRKYILRADEAETVLHNLDATTRVLEIDGQRASSYESVYFDTPELLSYRMAATGRRRRFKLRTRSYVDTAESYLEMKTRGARGTTVKDRLPYLVDDRDALTRDGREYADAALDSIGIAHPEDLYLVPTLVTRYRRATLYLPGSQSRTTIDTSLSWETDDGSVLRTSEVDRLLWSHGHRPATISKFGTGLAAMRRDLPSNKWARVLRRHFDA